MNWKTHLVLLFGKLRKPLEIGKEVSISKMRKQVASAATLGNKLFNKKLHIKHVRDTVADDVPVRIYYQKANQDQPIIIYYHGGGFVLYNIDSHDLVARRLCKMNNCTVVSVDYRLAPEHTFPAAHEDAFTAINWVLQKEDHVPGDRHKVIFAGDSAGGNLAACMAHKCKKEGIPVLAQVLVYPWIDGKLNNPSIERNGSGYLLTKEVMFWFQQQYTPHKEDQCSPEVSPCYESDFSNLPPAMIITAELDPLLDDGRLYAEQLREGGSEVVYKKYPQLPHGFFNIPGISDDAMRSYKHIEEFIRSLLKAKEKTD